MNRGNWTDNPCWYVSVQDAGRTALVLGPFRAESECRQYAYREMEEGGNSAKRHQVDKAAECDPRSWFYSWGMVKMQNGHRDGCLNSRMPETVHADMGREESAAKASTAQIPCSDSCERPIHANTKSYFRRARWV